MCSGRELIGQEVHESLYETLAELMAVPSSSASECVRNCRTTSLP